MRSSKDTRRWAGSSTGPAAEASPEAGVHHDHAVQFYRDVAFLHERVAAFLAEGDARGEPLVAFVASENREPICRRLASMGVDPEASQREGRLILEDAREALARFMRDGEPDPERFRASVGGILERSARGRSVSGTRVFGEMVSLLLEEGNAAAAIRTEELWNELARTHPCSVLCTYALRGFRGVEGSNAFREVARRHHRVLPAEDVEGSPVVDESPGVDALEREVARLQQQVTTLEAELARRESLEEALREALTARQRSEVEARRSQEEAERARAEADRANQAKSRFLTTMSHELRTPLTAIVGYQDLLDLELKGPINDDQRAYLHNINTAAQQLLQLIDQLLSLSRIEAGEEEVTPSNVDAARLARDVAALVEPVAREKGLSLELDVPDTAFRFRTDGTKLKQILLNLLSNAVKFTPAGGSVGLVFSEEDGNAFFRVVDTGMGIEPAEQARIFEPFVRLRRGKSDDGSGIGIGLALSRNIAELLGGELTLDSTPGKGSTFSVRLPTRGPRDGWKAP